ncbi:MAG TPA: metalloregulator ArsR/SmtB family transcription factor [Terracidiphilus sp.]
MRPSASAQQSGLSAFFRALADPTRLRLFNLMLSGEVCVCHFCEVLRLSQPMVSRHLAYLKRARLVAARREGRWIHYRWQTPREPSVRATMDGLRAGLSKDGPMTREREELKRVCC